MIHNCSKSGLADSLIRSLVRSHQSFARPHAHGIVECFCPVFKDLSIRVYMFTVCTGENIEAYFHCRRETPWSASLWQRRWRIVEERKRRQLPLGLLPSRQGSQNRFGRLGALYNFQRHAHRRQRPRSRGRNRRTPTRSPQRSQSAERRCCVSRRCRLIRRRGVVERCWRRGQVGAQRGESRSSRCQRQEFKRLDLGSIVMVYIASCGRCAR